MMKYLLLLFFLFSSVMVSWSQAKSPRENIVITYTNNKTQLHTDENGVLHVNVFSKDVLKFEAAGYVRYSDFGPRGTAKPMI